MNRKRKIALAFAGLLCVAALAFAGLTSTGAMGSEQPPISDEAAYKLAHDTDPHLPLTPEQEQVTALKDQILADAASGKITPAEAKARLLALKAELGASAATGTGSPKPVPAG